MCMFSRPVRYVAGTRIFARPGADGRQQLAYSMSVELDESLAMVLPLPVPPGSPEDAVRFIDLSGYPELFRDLDRAFPAMASRGGGPLQAARAILPQSTLKVHKVGSFEASFVPSQADFARLEPRFRIDPRVWATLPQYADWGFAVFKLAHRRRWFSSKRRTFHPMAFEFPRREPTELFFPTVHLHDGEVSPDAEFDHQLYCQPDPAVAATFAWRRSPEDAGEHVDAGRTQGLVDPEAPLYRETLVGTHPNVDVTLRAPSFDLARLRAIGRCHQLRLSALTAYAVRPSGRGARWAHVARHHMNEVAQALGDALDELAEQQGEAWALGRYDPSTPEYSISQHGSLEGQPNLILTGAGTGIPFMGDYRAPTGPGRVAFPLRDDERIEQQLVVLSFAEVPAGARLREIQAALDALLRRVPIGDDGARSPDWA